ncbi:flagellin [Donghicola sp. XS_ASV15]|uniref:flagellin n=1 Tax=Donghicola sp. XS_ASV15 TaxID=3241295 RepID=UPI003518E7A0
MSSILTNSSATVALQTLKSINNDLNKVQSEISTGMSVSSAKDNASVFAISKVMEADVAGFEAVSESLSLGQSTVAVAASAAEEVGELLNEVKTKIVSANEDNVDRNKLNTEVQSLVEQITGIVDSAQFNGLNILDGSKDGNGGFSVLSSLNRSADGSVSSGTISFDPSLTNLSTSSGTDLSAGTNPATTLTVPATYASADVGPDQSTIASITGANGFGLSQASGASAQMVIGDFELLASNGSLGGGAALAAGDVNLAAATANGGLVAGDKVSLTLGNTVATYTIGVGDRTEDIASGLRSSLIEAGIDQDQFTLDTNDSAGSLTINNNSEQTVNVSTAE